MTQTQTPLADEIRLGADNSITMRVAGFVSILVIYFFYCYNFMLDIFVRPTMIKPIAEGGFGFELTQAASIFAIMSFANVPGTILFGILSTKIGRKRTLMVIGLAISLLTALPLLNPTSVWLWYGARFITGVALGGVFGTVVPLVMDLFPARLRGSMVAIVVSLISVAMIFAGQLYSHLGDAHWMTLMLTAAIPPAIGVIMVFFSVPDDYQLALKEREKSLQDKGEKITYRSMYQGRYFWIGMGCILLSGLNFIGYSAFSNNATTYLTTNIGLTNIQAGDIFSLQGIGQLIGYNVWAFLATRYGHKLPLVGMAASALMIYFYMQVDASDLHLFKLLNFATGFCFGFSGAWGAYYTELFPKRFAGLAPGISFNGGRIISMIGLPIIAGLSYENSDGLLVLEPIFYVSMAILVLGAMVWFLLPETRNRPQED